MDPYRLPTTVVPTRYDLRLEPDLVAATFAGHVAIAVSVREPVVDVWLNAAELMVLGGHFEAATQSLSATVALEADSERCRLTFPTPLPVGDGRLVLRFQGTLNDKLRGFYRSRFKGAEGSWKVLAATQFEATDARRCFPCWDEPCFKAVFASTLVLDPALKAISNTSIVEEQPEGDRKRVRFADTIPMSTYLVAFVVGDLEATEPTLVGTTPLRVWCVPGKKHLASFGQAIGAFSLGFYEDYFCRPYPGDKLDLVAIPDFAAGAMENLGCITYRETALLVDEVASTHAERERVADVVAHENAHMWFGDLVTMSWWNGLWLNEAFATFLEMVAVDAWKPSWHRWTTFAVSRSAALAVDGLRSTRPIEFPVAAPRDAEAMFDVLTYEKGASVLRMLEQHVGPQVFCAGVRAYLARHAFGSTETEDLWRALAGATGLDVAAIMDGWVYRPGYPLLGARLSEGALVLTQHRFRYLPDAADEPAAPLWQVPVRVGLFTPGGLVVERVLLTNADATLALPPDTKGVLVNLGGHGFYRVRYSSELLTRLVRLLPDDLEAVDRFNLVNDCWAAVLAGLLPLSEYLDLTARFRSETDRNVWSVLIASFQTLNRLIEAADRSRFQALVRDRLGPAVAALGWNAAPEEDELVRQLRGDLLRAFGTLGNDAVAQARAAEILDAGPDADVLAAAIPILAHAGSAERYDDFLARLRTARTPQEEQRYLLALAAFRTPELIARTLDLTLSGEVRTQDVPFVLRALLLSVDGREAAWAFVRTHWDRLRRDLPLPGLKRLFEGLLGLGHPIWEREVRTFCADRQISLGGKTLDQILEQLHVLVSLRDRENSALQHNLGGGS